MDFPAAQELPSQHKDLRALPAKESQWTAEEQERMRMRMGELRPRDADLGLEMVAWKIC